jgi:hypothetical protein
MSDNINAFFGGAAIGLLVFVLIVNAFDASPAATARKIHTEAVSRGYGEWVVKTNDFDASTPRTEFRWK